MTFKKIISNPTLFILSSILLLIGIPYGIYGLTLDGGASLGGVLILMADFVIFIALLIDRAIVNKIPPKRLSIYEFVFLVICIMIYSYSQRKLIVDVENDNVEYFNINADWNSSYYYNRYEFEKYPKVTFFCKTSLDFKRDMNQNRIDSLINNQ